MLGLLITFPMLSSCAKLVTNTLIEPTVDNMQYQTDLDLVCEGSAAYLLMIDSMITSKPANKDLLRVGSQAYIGYLSAIPECAISGERLDTVAEKARQYGTRLLAELLPMEPGTDPDTFDQKLDRLGESRVPDLFWGTMAWLSWIQTQQGSPASMADLVTVEKLMERLLELDDEYQSGAVHVFFGAYDATKPEMFGGDPQKSRRHFERALQIGDRRFLLTQTTYAETYARQSFNQILHDRLLQEVLDFPLDEAPEYALSNQIAKKKARRLLDEDFFAE